MNCEVLIGDCREVLADLEDESIDAIVSDPPYELGFMGKGWDASGVAYSVDLWREANRVLKPGGHLLAFGGTRTYHRLAVAIEDAGFEIRDSIHWVYATGFPKSHDVSKAIDREAGAKRKVVGQKLHARKGVQAAETRTTVAAGSYGEARMGDVTAPATDAAREWEGWGTALKPAHEPIVVARKPLTGTVAANVQEHGTGALNIDGCRVEHDGTGKWGTINKGDARSIYGSFGDEDGETPTSVRNSGGRWPPNFTLTHLPDCADDCAEGCPVAEMDGQSGESRSQGGRIGKKAQSDVANVPAGQYEKGDPGYGDTGGASRFFPVFRYQAKAGKAERNAGNSDNHHPTVKPIDLMRWLVRLVTPPGGTVLDPFLGSGTTGIAAHLEGCDFVGIEREAEYAEIAKARIAHFQDFDSGTDTDAAVKGKDALTHDGQLSIGDAA